MNQQYFQRLTQMIRNVQKPLQAITELNIKTMQNLSYMKPDELVHIKPEEFVERQINVVIENGHKTLDYMQKTFEILEKAVFITNDKLKETTDSMVDKAYPGNNMGVANAMASPSNMMMDMAQSVFDPMSNPVMNAAREAFNPTIPMEELARATSSRPRQHVKTKTKQAGATKGAKSQSTSAKSAKAKPTTAKLTTAKLTTAQSSKGQSSKNQTSKNQTNKKQASANQANKKEKSQSASKSSHSQPSKKVASASTSASKSNGRKQAKGQTTKQSHVKQSQSKGKVSK